MFAAQLDGAKELVSEVARSSRGQ